MIIEYWCKEEKYTFLYIDIPNSNLINSIKIGHDTLYICIEMIWFNGMLWIKISLLLINYQVFKWHAELGLNACYKAAYVQFTIRLQVVNKMSLCIKSILLVAPYTCNKALTHNIA